MLRQLAITLAVLAAPAVGDTGTDVLECSLRHSTDITRTQTYRVYYDNSIPYHTYIEEVYQGSHIPSLTICMYLPDLRCIMDQRWLDVVLETSQYPAYGIPESVTTQNTFPDVETTDIWNVNECGWK
jgi:hypothetical protein